MTDLPHPRRPSWRTRARGTFVALGLALVITSPVGLAVGAAFAVPARIQEQPGEGLASPRAVLESLLLHLAEWRATDKSSALERAARALDLRGFPSADRRYLERKFPRDLAELLEKLGPVEPSVLPDAAGVGDRTSAAHTFVRADRPEVEIELEFTRVDEGDWRLSGSTLAHLAGWTERFRDVAPVVPRAGTETTEEWVESTVPPAFHKQILFLEAWQWIGFAGLVLAGIVAQRLASLLFARFVAHAAKSHQLAVDKQVLGRVARPVALLATSLAFFAGVPLLDLDPRAFHVANLLANVGLAVALVWTFYRLVDVLSWVMGQRALLTETKFDDMLVPLLRRTLKFVVLLLGVVLIVARLDRDLWSLVAGLSIGSLAIGLAAKASIENLFGTFTVLMDKPFQLGDGIVMGGIEGTVESVGMRSTHVRTADDSLITVPNSLFIAAHVENRGLRRRQRVRAVLALEYGTPPERIEAFCEGVRELIRRHPFTRKTDYQVWLNALGVSSLELVLSCFLEVPDGASEPRERHRLWLDILRLAERTQVHFAFPSQTVRLERAGERAEGEPAPASTSDAVGRGRRAAEEIAQESLRPYAGKRPPLIRFDTASADDAGHGPLS